MELHQRDRGDEEGGVSDASRYSIPVLSRLVDSGLAEVVIRPDGTPTLAIDPVFERARAAAMAGFDDIDRSRARVAHVAQHLRPTG